MRPTVLIALVLVISPICVLIAWRSLYASGNTITVNTLSDSSTSGDGLCSLREAINNANAESDTTGGDCVAGTGNDTIDFSVSGTITLGSALPAIQNTLTIDGSGQNVTIDGAGSYQVLYVKSRAATLNLNSLTIADGSSTAGGGIYSNAGTLTVNNSTFSGNSANFGGGIYNNTGTLTVSNSTFSGNIANAGGGIVSTGVVTVSNSTFSGNLAVGDGGGIYNNADMLTVNNSTFSGNGAASFGGGIYNTTGTVTVTNSTFSGNGADSFGGGIYNSTGIVTVTNGILAGRSGGNCSGTITNGGYNISDDATCGFGAGTGANGRTVGNNVNPLLDPNGLQNNGGPTETIALGPGSPAIASVPLAQCTVATDQRGEPRPAPGYNACDIGAFESQAPPWGMSNHDLRHTGLSPFDTSANPGLQKWAFATVGAVDSSPAVGADGTIYVGSGDDTVHAVNPDGTQKWAFATGGAVDSSPAIGADGTIYVGSMDNHLYAVNSADGSQKWAFATGGPVDSSPAIGADGTIYVGSTDNNLYAVNSADGSQKWAFATGGPVDSSPAIGADGTVYVGSGDDLVYAVNPDGTLKWAFGTGGAVDSSPAIGADGTIYVGSGDDNVYAVNPDGTQKWAFATGGAVDSSPAIGADGTIYVGSGDDNVYALTDGGQGTVTTKWKFTTGGPVQSSLAVGADGTIYVGSADDNAYALTDRGQGKVTMKWEFATGSSVQSSPAVGADGTIYIGSTDDNLYAVGTCPSCPTPTPTASATRTARPTPTPTPVAIVPASLASGNEPVDDTVTKNLTVKNTGHAALFVTSVSSNNPAEFAVGTSTCPSGGSGLAPGLTCTIAIGFTPSALGTCMATLTVNDNTARSPQHVALSGTGTIDMTVSPTSYAFGNVKDVSTKTKSITVHNFQTNSVSLSEGFSGSNPGDFSVTGGTCTSTLAAKTACSMIVTFAPIAVGAESATMTVTDGPDPLGPYTVSLSGTGSTPLNVSPASVPFGAIVVGHSSTNKTVKITNNGSATLTISKSISGTNAADFAATGGTCGTTLAGGGAHCTYILKFTPSIVGAESATLGVSAVGDAASPHNVSLTGTGA